MPIPHIFYNRGNQRVPGLELDQDFAYVEDLVVAETARAEAAEAALALQIGLFINIGTINIPTGSDLVQTSGYGIVGTGGARYYATTNTGATRFRAQSLNGRWFELQEDFTSTPMFGGGLVTSADDGPILQAQNDYCAARGKLMFVPPVTNGYPVKTPVTITCRNLLGGASADGTPGVILNWNPTTPSDLQACLTCTGGAGATIENITIYGPTSYTTATLVSSGTVTVASLPNYSAFASGVAAFATGGSGKVTFVNCIARNVKVGLLLNNTDGHVNCYDCYFFGLFGVYCLTNTFDYLFLGGEIGGAWASVLFGTLPYGGHNGGIDATFIRCHLGFSPYGFYQCSNSGVSIADAGTYAIYLISTSLEQIGEACIKSLDSTAPASVFHVDHAAFSWATTTYTLPDAVIAAGSKQAYAFWFATLGSFKCSLNQIPGFGGFTSSPINTSGKIARILVDATPDNDSQLDTFAGSLTIVVANNKQDNLRFVPGRDFVKRADKAIVYDVRPANNLLKPPETAGSWTCTNGAITTASLSSLTGVGGPLASAAFPRAFYEELGNNPTAIIMTASAAAWFAHLGFFGGSFAAGQDYPSMSMWVVSPTHSVGIRSRFNDSSNTTVYDVITTTVSATCTKIYGVGKRTIDVGGNGIYVEYQVFPNAGASNDVVYMFGVMAAANDLQPYNPNPGPTLDAPVYLTGQTLSTTASIGAGSALPALPSGYLTQTINGTVVKIPYYLP